MKLLMTERHITIDVKDFSCSILQKSNYKVVKYLLYSMFILVKISPWIYQIDSVPQQ